MASLLEAIGGVHRGAGGRLLEGFLKRCLPEAVSYRRAAGFFSSSAFTAASVEFADFFGRGGRMELVCSPVVSGPDLRAIHDGLYHPRRWLGRSLHDIARSSGGRRGAELLSWAVARRQVEVRIALIVGGNPRAIYHEKIGLFGLDDGGAVAFEGSANESASAYADNFERVLVHESPRPGGTGWADGVARSFERLWANETPGLTVLTFHEALRRRVLRPRGEPMSGESEEFTPDGEPAPEAPPETLRLPARFGLRDYQEQAIARWFENKGRGVLAMATGTGKTVTALAAAEAVFSRAGAPLVVIVVAPYLHLVRQWVGVAKGFGLDPLNCSGPRASWTGAVDAALYLVSAGKRPILSLVTTNATFADAAFQSVLARLTVRTLLIADEVHNLGARALQAKLPDRVALRLGLSATPERHRDEDGSRAIRDYFGEVVFELDLAQAMQLKPPVLTPYTYHPVLVALDADEREEYLRITKQLAKSMFAPKAEDLSDATMALLLKRSRLVACARNKLPALAAAIAPFRATRFNLVYCGDGRSELEGVADAASGGVPESNVVRQVEAVASLLGSRLGMNVGVYTAETPDADRQVLLRDFEAGNKNALIAIRCLDEGIDIPQVRRAFILASSTNPRQFVQRRGRVLRRAEGKESAEIYDFLVAPPLDSVTEGTAEYRVLRNLVSREMERVVEFARLAENGPQAHARLLPILSALKLMHL